MVKIVYVVVSSEKDFYLEQFVISSYSLRLRNPSFHITLVTDEDTARMIDNKKPYVRDYYDERLEIKCPANYDNLRKSRYIKTSLRSHLEGDFLFIDTDTAIARPLGDIDGFKGDVYAVPDKHLRISEHQGQEILMNDAKIAGFTLTPDDYYLNSGVMLVRDTETARKLYEEWHKTWLNNIEKGLLRDQPALARADETMGHLIKLLPHEWNCQVVENGLKYLQNAYIIHYFASNKNKLKRINPYLLHDNAYYEMVRKKRGVPEEIKKICESPQTAFRDNCRIVSGVEAEFLFNNPLITIKMSYPKIYNIIIKTVDYLYSLRKKFGC